jgi:putative Mg2+ transporter-C (MgtC) family protein
VTTLVQLQGFLDLVLACLLASVLGFEREVSNKPAGLRTHVLVAAAVSLFIFVGRQLVADAGESSQTDPVRMLEAIATAVSFLGAGTIIFRKNEGVVEGLTTASSLLLVAAVAMATAVQLYVLAVAVTVFAVAVLRGLRFVEKRIPRENDAQSPQREQEQPNERRAPHGSTPVEAK